MAKLFPKFYTKAERDWYEKTPKRVLFAIMRDYAMQEVGESVALENKDIVLADIEERQKIITRYGFDKA